MTTFDDRCFQLLVENISEGMIVSDNIGNILYINEPAKKLLNITNRTSLSLSSLLKMEKINTYHQKLYSSNKVILITIKDAQLNNQPIKLYYLTDITEQEQKENELLILNTILDYINEGITVINSQGKVILYNSSASNMEGLSRELVLDRHINELYNCIGGSAFLKVLTTKKAIQDTYFNYTATKTGAEIRLVGNTCPIFKDHKVIAVFSIFRNASKLHYLWSKTMELQDKLLSSTSYKNNGTTFTFSHIIGTSKTLKEVISYARKTAISSSSVLIYGETGTGKELFAQSIHNESANKNHPFIAINCAAIPESLLESILFGTAKGAFTGAQDLKGLFEQAGSGTLFLDEINSMPINLQAKLLRVLQEKTIRKIGATNEIPILCRIISSTNANPQECVSNGSLRKDLYYRLAVICLNIPPLRDRGDDVKLLANHFLKKFTRLYGLNSIKMSEQFQNILTQHTWPGNVRELEHTLESSVTMIEGEEELGLQHLPPHLRSKFLKTEHSKNNQFNFQGTLGEILKTAEKDILLHTLQNHNWNISRSAQYLGIRRSNLQYRMRRLQINKID